jgi:tRNA A37 methylthiotransferase MiaB
MKGLGGQTKKDRSKELSEAKMEVVGAAHDDIVGTTRRVLAVAEGTGDSVKCRDDAYHQIVVQNADEHGLEPGEFCTVEVTDHNTVYAFGTPVEARTAAPR